MDWLQIGSAVFMLAMLVYIFPRMRQALKHSPKGTMKDWLGYLFPLGMVVLFVAFLIMSVR